MYAIRKQQIGITFTIFYTLKISLN